MNVEPAQGERRENIYISRIVSVTFLGYENDFM